MNPKKQLKYAQKRYFNIYLHSNEFSPMKIQLFLKIFNWLNNFHQQILANNDNNGKVEGGIIEKELFDFAAEHILKSKIKYKITSNLVFEKFTIHYFFSKKIKIIFYLNVITNQTFVKFKK